MRKLSDLFLQDLKSGFLTPLITSVKQDQDLDLEIREGYLNIYFKGNSLLKLSDIGTDSYRIDIHPKFSGGIRYSDLVDAATTQEFLSQIPAIKEKIIQYGKSSLEIEYEQMIIRANNFEPRNASEYFFVDRQYVAGKAERFDLTGFNWPRRGRRRNQVVPVCLYEVKFALNQDIQDVHEQLNRYYQAIQGKEAEIALETETIFHQKLELGLFNQPADRLEAMRTLTFSRELNHFQFILVLVDYNPNSRLFAQEKLKQLPFASQVKIYHGGFAMWENRMMPVNTGI